MDHHIYCAACLVTNVKMYDLSAKHKSSSSTLGLAFSRLLQIPMFEKNHNVCFECTQLMYKMEEFKLRCLKAQSILSALPLEDDKAIKEIIQRVDRKSQKLTSNLTLSSITIIDSTYEDLKLNNETINIQPKIKTEIEEIIQNDANAIDIKHCEEITDMHIDFIANADDCYTETVDCYYSEDSLHIDSNVTIEKTQKVRKEPKARKRKGKSVKTDDIDNDVCDDEPLSKVSKRLIKNKDNVKNYYPKNFNISFFKDYATVVLLTPDDAKKELLLRKESKNYKTCPFKCEFCYKGYESKGTYDNHMKKHNVENGEFKCDICHLRYPALKFLYKHRQSCHKRKFYCQLCPYVCFCTDQAKNHVSFHKGQKYPCQECDAVFSMPNSLFMHKREKHMTQCVCDMCGSTFVTTRGLYSHKMMQHSQDVNDKQGPQCNECNIHFATEMAWKKHLVLSPKHNVSNGCKHCGETFPNMKELKAHAKNKHARKRPSTIDEINFPTNCKICDKRLTKRSEYKSHMFSVHPQSDVAKMLTLEDQTPFVCEICGRMFKTQFYLRSHQRTRCDSRPDAGVTCRKSSDEMNALSSVLHDVVRENNKYSCKLCERLLATRSSLRKHMQAHLNIRPHKCMICDKSFINPCDRNLHVKYVHNKMPWPKRDRNKRKNV